MKVPFLARYIQTLAIAGSSVVKELHSFVSVSTSFHEYEVASESHSSSALACFAMNSSYMVFILSQEKHQIKDKLEEQLDRAWVMVHHWEVSYADRTILEEQLVGIDVMVVT